MDIREKIVDQQKGLTKLNGYEESDQSPLTGKAKMFLLFQLQTLMDYDPLNPQNVHLSD